ncbi:MAG: outer membrane protein assembly factor BamB [Verrucomicrobiota bacterium]
MMKILTILVPALFFAIQLVAALPDSQNWGSFRGPNSSGTSESALPPVKFGPEENVLWKADAPWSPSSPCVWGKRLFITTFHEGNLETRCHDAGNGKLLWTRVASRDQLEEFHATEGSPASSTPATDGKHVVSYFGSCGLVCHDFDGKELWRHPLPVARTAGGFGSGVSPIIAGKYAIVNRDQAKNSFILAVRLSDGKTAWETPRVDSPTSYGTPILCKNNGAEEIVMAGSLTLKAYDLKSGEERWRMTGLPAYTCTTPVLGGGLLFFAGWSPGKSDSPWPKWENILEKQDKNGDGIITVDEYKDGPVWFKAQDIDGNGKLERSDWDSIGGMMKRGENVLLAIQPGGHGDVTATHVAWKFDRGLPYVPSPLYYDRKVYLIKDGGMLSCFDAESGRARYTQERLNAIGTYYASPIAADGRLYLFSMDGKATVVKAGGDKPEILHRADFGERIAATPALVGTRMYVRTRTKLYAFGTR